jgi:hypothetical protein
VLYNCKHQHSLTKVQLCRLINAETIFNQFKTLKTASFPYLSLVIIIDQFPSIVEEKEKKTLERIRLEDKDSQVISFLKIRFIKTKTGG